MYNPGDIILAKVQFTDTFETKTRPALVLFEEFNNIIVAGITSNLEMDGIPLSKKEGSTKKSIIKLNYIFTISNIMVVKKLFHLTKQKKKLVFEELNKKLKRLL